MNRLRSLPRGVLALLSLMPVAVPAARPDPNPGMAMPHHEYRTLLIDVPQLEWRDGDHGDGLAWDGALSWGGDLDRLVVTGEGERIDGVTGEHELAAFWQHAWLANWSWELGLREDAQPGNPRVTWARAGLSGEAPGFVETRASLYLSEYEQTELRLEFEKEVLFTQRLVLEPEIEVSVFHEDEPWRGVASGLATSELELRLKYEVTREFAPYVGVVYEYRHGATADLHEEDSSSSLVAGASVWF